MPHVELLQAYSRTGQLKYSQGDEIQFLGGGGVKLENLFNKTKKKKPKINPVC